MHRLAKSIYPFPPTFFLLGGTKVSSGFRGSNANAKRSGMGLGVVLGPKSIEHNVFSSMQREENHYLRHAQKG